LGERCVRNAEVEGSIPFRSTDHGPLILLLDLRVYEDKWFKRESPVKSLEASQLRGSFADALDTVAAGGQRIAVVRDGKQVAALVPPDDLAMLEALEDRIDVVLAKKALREKGSVPWSHVKKRLGLK
jgi:PHD/YefM family antitoxin component YafN of YafNO toxin-antitoxin module